MIIIMVILMLLAWRLYVYLWFNNVWSQDRIWDAKDQ